MGLESATYIDELNPANPVGSDSLGAQDDHTRMIKKALQNSLPKDLRGVSGPGNYQRLMYDGNSFKNFAVADHPWLRAEQNGLLGVGTGTDYVVWNSSGATDNLGVTFAGGDTEIGLPGDFDIADLFLSTQLNVDSAFFTANPGEYMGVEIWVQYDTGSGFTDDAYFGQRRLYYSDPDLTSPSSIVDNVTMFFPGFLTASVDAVRIRAVALPALASSDSDVSLANTFLIMEARG